VPARLPVALPAGVALGPEPGDPFKAPAHPPVGRIVACPALPDPAARDRLHRLVEVTGVAMQRPMFGWDRLRLTGLAPGDTDIWAVCGHDSRSAVVRHVRVTVPPTDGPDSPTVALSAFTKLTGGVMRRLRIDGLPGSDVLTRFVSVRDAFGRRVPLTDPPGRPLNELFLEIDTPCVEVVATDPGSNRSYAAGLLRWSSAGADTALTSGPASSLRVRVLAVDGTPIAGARCRAFTPAGIDVTPTGDLLGYIFDVGPCRPTDADGRTTIPGLRTGPHRIMASAPGFLDGVATVEVAAARMATIRLTPSPADQPRESAGR
jgi:hypothetical protein